MKRKLQVFISSTYSDLKDERQAAVEAILKAGHIPAGMELFTAGDKSQMVAIERWIDESDVFMLILGGRYGSIEPKTGLSYVELEYDYAVAQRKPTFAVVINDTAIEARVKTAGTAVIEKINQKGLEQFREKVLKNISSFFNDPKDVKLCVYESMSDYATDPNLKGWIAADEVQESKVLLDEIGKLRDENRALTERISGLQTSAMQEAKSPNVAEDKELTDVLRAIEIRVPADLAGGKEVTMSLLDIAYGNRDTLINGVTNAMNASPAEAFFFFNIIPKLQAHGLAENQREAGMKYRRAFLNKKGQMLLAGIEKRRLLSKASEQVDKPNGRSKSTSLSASDADKQAATDHGTTAKKSSRRKPKASKASTTT